jgi:VIT1/CCC1 family predicted Fe2+/Mn2+ transporter
LASIYSRDEKLWVDEMMVQQLSLLPNERMPILSALAMPGFFIVAGSVPLVICFLGLFISVGPAASFEICIVLSALALFGLGAAKVLVTEGSWIRTGLEMLLVGGLAAGVAYLVGFLLTGLGA